MDQDELKQDLEEEVTVEEDKAEEEKQEIPAELEGLSDEVIKETMAELEPKQDAEAVEAEDEEKGENAEPNSDNKSSIEPILDRPKQKIPYERFKKEVDEKKNLKAEVDNLKAELAAMKNNTATQVPQAQQQQVTVPQPQVNNVQPGSQGFRFTPEVTTAIKQAIKEQAMQMSGLTQEDIDNLDYMDDEDQRKQQWHFANKAAEARVMGAIQQAQQQRDARALQFMAQHQRSVDGYNAFVQEQMKEPDFDEIRGYIEKTYFANLPDDEKPVIGDAYSRIERNTASPADIALIKRFYQDAKTSYRSKAGENKKPGSAVEKIKQASAHPRAESVEGAAAKTGGPSVAALERMLNEKNWDDIPKEYQDILLGL